MITYEYGCKSGGFRFRQFQKITDDPVESCPECSGSVQRIISGGVDVIMKKSDRPNITENTQCCGMENPCSNPKRCCGN